MPKLEIKFNAATAKRFPVYKKYRGQILEQKAFLSLDLRDGTLLADYDSTIGDSVPKDVWNDIILRFKLEPQTTAGRIEQIINENKELFQAILDDSKVILVNGDHKGYLGKRARDLFDSRSDGSLFRFLTGYDGGIIDLAQWIEDKPFPANGQSLESFAQQIIDTDGLNDFYFLEPYTIDSLLSDLRDIWASMLYAGETIPNQVAQHLIAHGTCDDSQWLDELREFASS